LTLDCSHYRRPPFQAPRQRLNGLLPVSRQRDDDRKDHFLLRTHPRAPRSSRAHCDNRSNKALLDILAYALPCRIGCVSSSQC